MAYRKQQRYRSPAEKAAKCHDCGNIGHYAKHCYVGKGRKRSSYNRRY